MFARSDETLYQQLLEGDLRAFDALYERYERPLFGFLRRQLANAAEAEDVLHETFLSVLKDRSGARTLRSFRAWLFQVARNLCLNRARSSRRSALAVERDGTIELAPLSPDAVLERRQTADALAAAVAKLPAPMAELYHLRAGGLSYEELADVLRVPLGTVKSRLHELVRRLRDEVAP